MKLPFKNVWNAFYFQNKFTTQRPLCFVFASNNYWFRSVGYFEYLKQHYTDCKLVLSFEDVVDRYFERYFDFDIEYVNSNFDLIITYNKLDAEKYGFIYYPTCMNKIEITSEKRLPKTDIFYVGRAKDRLQILQELAHLFTSNGLTCDFNIVGVDKANQLNIKGIRYNNPIPYVEVIERIKHSDCILEISQNDALGFTIRTTEALLYNKKLISNNPILVGTKFYNPEYVFYFKDVADIDTNKIKTPVKVDYHYDGEYSPLNFLKFIEIKLS